MPVCLPTLIRTRTSRGALSSENLALHEPQVAVNGAHEGEILRGGILISERIVVGARVGSIRGVGRDSSTAQKERVRCYGPRIRLPKHLLSTNTCG